jgi:hypothetical protein
LTAVSTLISGYCNSFELLQAREEFFSLVEIYKKIVFSVTASLEELDDLEEKLSRKRIKN